MTALSWYARLGVLALAVALMLGALFGAYQHGVTVTDLRWQAKTSDGQLLQAKGAAAAVATVRTEEQRRQMAVNEVGHVAQTETQAAVTDGLAADATGERLHLDAGRFAATACPVAADSAAAQRGASATRAAMVLSDLFQRADQRAGELAKAYDGARIAGLACEKSYNSLRGAINFGP